MTASLNKARLEELAAMVERAVQADREMDCLIENALGIAKFERDPRVGYGDANYDRVPPKPYSASLDAAMSLVPEGWLRWTSNENGYEEATLNNHTLKRTAWGTGATPALALLACTLKALAAQVGEQ